MTPIKDGYVLSTGREFYANNRILGISPNDPSVCSEGYDGSVGESRAWEEWMDEAGQETFTPEERAEIAAYMIDLWKKFGGLA